MTGKVDITAPGLPKVAEPDTTHPALPSVKETVAALEPVDASPVSTASTLELDPQEDVITDERPVYLPRSVRAQKLDLLAGESTARRGRALRVMKTDGFEGASVENALPATEPSRSASTRTAWILIALVLAALAIFLTTKWL